MVTGDWFQHFLTSDWIGVRNGSTTKKGKRRPTKALPREEKNRRNWDNNSRGALPRKEEKQKKEKVKYISEGALPREEKENEIHSDQGSAATEGRETEYSVRKEK